MDFMALNRPQLDEPPPAIAAEGQAAWRWASCMEMAAEAHEALLQAQHHDRSPYRLSTTGRSEESLEGIREGDKRKGNLVRRATTGKRKS
jgi:hypothetical protein